MTVASAQEPDALAFMTQVPDEEEEEPDSASEVISPSKIRPVLKKSSPVQSK